ncbi:MAG: hypothetical protein QMC90_03545 [Dehalococcoidales bacterium]|nr:hypothetical protein [Dehalococcoidales bacterium]
MRRMLFLLLVLAVVGLPLGGCGEPGVTKEQQEAVAAAKEHLQRYGHYPPIVERVEVCEGEGVANRYWERFGQLPIESPPKYRCWIVRFYYPGLYEGSHLVVYVDKRSGEVIGGTQTR